MNSFVLVTWMGTLSVAACAQPATTPKGAVEQFERGIEAHNLALIAEVVAPDIVVFENGRQNNGWVDFRDQHLVPEFKEPAFKLKSDSLQLNEDHNTAWGFRHATANVPSSTGSRVMTLWSSYVLQRDTTGEWKIKMLNWSVKAEHTRGTESSRP
ncbi:MAG: hypothetical protein NVS9B15_23490 [Acidobacteriaceae bacterium]